MEKKQTPGEGSGNKTLPARPNWFILPNSNIVLFSKKSLLGHGEAILQNITLS